LLLAGGMASIVVRKTKLGPAPKAALWLLSVEQHAVLAAVAARVVPGDGAGPEWPSAEALDCAGKIDALMGKAHPDAGRDFKRVLSLFESGFGGLVLGHRPTPFTQLSAPEQDARLHGWRHARLGVLQSGYQAMVRLVHAVYFSSPEIYSRIGYPGPPVVPT
jgi:hypothetical protein